MQSIALARQHRRHRILAAHQFGKQLRQALLTRGPIQLGRQAGGRLVALDDAQLRIETEKGQPLVIRVCVER